MKTSRKLRQRLQVPNIAAPRVAKTNMGLAWLYFASGIPALICQTIWQRLLVLHSGVGTTSVAIIVACYMLGMGVGSLLGARLSRRLQPATALLCFAIFEFGIGLCALASPTVLYQILYLRYGWMYGDLTVACLLHFLVLILPTTLMGATLPLMTRSLVKESESAARSISILYGLNTLGAAFGSIVAPWLLLPYLGVVGVMSVSAACSISVASSAVLIVHRSKSLTKAGLASSISPMAPHGRIPLVVQEPQSESATFPVWVALFFLSGFCAIGLEMVWFRVLDVAVKSTSFTFGTVLGTFLTCMAIGSIVGARRIKYEQNPLETFLRIQCVILAFAAGAMLLVGYWPSGWWGGRSLASYWANPSPISPSWIPVRKEFWPTVQLYLALPVVLLGGPTFLMGYSFSVVQRGVQRDVVNAGYRVGILQAANIAGCVIGSMLVGLWLLKVLGSMNTMRMLIACGLIFTTIGLLKSTSRTWFVKASLILMFMVWSLPNNESLWRRLHGQGAETRFLVAEDLTGVAALSPEPDSSQWRVWANGKSQSNLPFGGVHSKLGAMPATLHKQPKTIAIIGLGSGDTAWAAACRPETEAIRVFEICTSEEKVLRDFAVGGNWPQLERLLTDKRVRIDGRDARFILMTSLDKYDLIEADAIRPNGAFAGYLYSVEFFQLCASRLNEGGFMCSWAPTSGTHSTFRRAFPHVLELEGGFVLIGSNQPIALDREDWFKRIRDAAEYLGPLVERECLDSANGSQLLQSPAEGDWVNTDLFPFDEFR